MAYSILCIGKIKNYGSLKSKYNHNRRIANVENADPELLYLNESISSEGNTPMDYAAAVKDRISQLPYYNNRKLRSDQVLALEVLLSFSGENNHEIDIQIWKKHSVKWLQQTFDVALDKNPNVLSIEYHMDETSPHIHAIVVPVDPRGHLNAHYFTNGSRAMSALQTSYANCLKDLGIERGVEGSSASHQKIRKMYAALNNATKIPEVLEGETAEQYRTRMLDDLETRFASYYKKANEYSIRKRQEADQYFNDKKEDLANESEIIRNQIRTLLDQLYSIQSDREETEKQKENSQKYSAIVKGLEVIRAEDPESADRLKDAMDYAESRSEEWEALAELNKEEEEEDWGI